MAAPIYLHDIISHIHAPETLLNIGGISETALLLFAGLTLAQSILDVTESRLQKFILNTEPAPTPTDLTNEDSPGPTQPRPTTNYIPPKVKQILAKPNGEKFLKESLAAGDGLPLGGKPLPKP
jgi:hypothetical protein